MYASIVTYIRSMKGGKSVNSGTQQFCIQ